ncbi:MAG: response regulator, partial [Alphaproteobacteria bacterium]|nr:response regulator [Alphaproteobacteria bacterium]
MRSLGYAVHTFASANDFLESSHVKTTSCIVADVHMPGMSGLELQGHLRGRAPAIPLIFIT